VDLSNANDQLLDFVGEIPYNHLIMVNCNFWTLKAKLRKLLEGHALRYLVEFLPSDVILTQVFNGKIRLGEVTLSAGKPSVIVGPYYVLKALKDWDLIVHSQKLGNLRVVVTNTDDVCQEREIAVRELDISAKLFEKKYVATCGKESLNEVKVVKAKVNEIFQDRVAVVYSNEVQGKYLDTGVGVDFYAMLFKNPTKEEVEIYEEIRRDGLVFSQ